MREREVEPTPVSGSVIPTFSYTPTGPRVVFGVGSAERELSSELDMLGMSRVLLLSTAREHHQHSEVIRGVGRRIVAHITDIRRHVPRAVAQAAIDIAREKQVDGLLSIGGGSTTGTAKAIALDTGLPILAVPTTYAGSEITPIYGLTDNGVKETGRSPRVLPRTVLYDPTLAMGLPRELTTTSAINALAHCVSGMFTAASQPVSDLFATTGIKALATGLYGTVADPDDLRARYQLSYGSYLAGTVLATAGSGLHHTICHILGGAYDLPHAQTHAALLPHVLRFLQPWNPIAAREIASALGRADGDAASAVQHLIHSIGAQVRLRDIGLPKTDIAKATDLLYARLGHHGKSVPSRPELLALVQAAYDPRMEKNV